MVPLYSFVRQVICSWFNFWYCQTRVKFKRTKTGGFFIFAVFISVAIASSMFKGWLEFQETTDTNAISNCSFYYHLHLFIFTNQLHPNFTIKHRLHNAQCFFLSSIHLSHGKNPILLAILEKIGALTIKKFSLLVYLHK